MRTVEKLLLLPPAAATAGEASGDAWIGLELGVGADIIGCE